MTRILITGGSGFVGHRLLSLLSKMNYPLRATYFNNKPENDFFLSCNIDWRQFNLIDEKSYDGLLKDIDIVIHLAGMAHIKRESADSSDKFRKVNAEATTKLIKEAAKYGVNQFVFISTIKVSGERTEKKSDNSFCSFKETDTSDASGSYAESKYEAEIKLIEICQETGMKYTVFRPPLIYGPGVKANFFNLIKLMDLKIPLPLANIDNLRSILYVDNFCDAVIKSIGHDHAMNERFFIKDKDISTPELMKIIAAALDKPACLFPIPLAIMNMVATLFFRKEQYNKLTDSLVVDDSKFRKNLNWSPPVKFSEAIQATTTWYKNQARRAG
jgi:UDP-N-acetyl-alpha-D-quinovosamine dehydrogenase